MPLNLEEKLLKRKRKGNLRRLQIVPPLLDFSSNDYLGLARSSLLTSMVEEEVARKAKGRSPFGSTGSRLLTGNSAYAQELENRLAQFHGYEAGLLFNCGYMANLGLLSAMMNHSDTVYFDACIHASSHDGIRLSRAKAFPFRHNDMVHLEKRLQLSPSTRNRFICVESIYSMDGSKTPLTEVCLLAKKYDAKVIVDEAHAIGVCGPLGQGLIQNQHSFPEVFAKIVTFGKALGVHGAIVLGNHTLKQALINFSNPYIYTTALPLHALAAIKCTYSLFPTLQNERQDLDRLIQIFRTNYHQASETHIQSFPIKGNEEAKQLVKWLSFKGYDVRAILSPTVQRGHEILRISLHAFNQEKQLIELIKHLKSYGGHNDE
jgi:8-amino-7-oxononanoate synthase